MTTIDRRLSDLGLSLPEPKAPVANYRGTKQSGDLLFVSGRVSDVRGEVGTEISLPEAKAAARATVLDLLAIVRHDIGSLDRIVSVDQVRGFVRSASTFTAQPEVIDGASDLLIELWGDAGRHARTATGAAQLPFGAAVQLDMILRLGADQAGGG
jgi:enamine deaminase RidA (YjgF/YER057c/UK114 family)